MAEPQTFPPPPEVIAAMHVMPRTEMAPTMLVIQEGPDGELGPEAAGAILILQATFTSEEGARHFWEAALPLMTQLADAPGFIRRYSFPVQRAITLIALWRTIDDARRYAASPEHRAASRALFAGRWQHSHFSALWEMRTNHGRVFICDGCGATTKAPADTCQSCGAPIIDLYRAQAESWNVASDPAKSDFSPSAS